MSEWIDRILHGFTADLERLWIAVDPDDVLLDERLLSVLRERGFELLPFDDSVAFRAEYESRYREAWDLGQDGPYSALILQSRATTAGEVPWDYASRARWVRLSLADLFSKLSYTVVRQIEPGHYDVLYAAQERHAAQSLGESLTKDFILTHVFGFSPHLISRSEDFWRALLRLHYRDMALPTVLGDYVAEVLRDVAEFQALPVSELFCSKATLLRVVQNDWYRYLSGRGVPVSKAGEPLAPSAYATAHLPFDHPDVRTTVDSMFIDGLLQPVVAFGALPILPDWAKLGVVQDPSERARLVKEAIRSLLLTLPQPDCLNREWMGAARRLGELLFRFHALDSASADGVRDSVAELRTAIDDSLRQWIRSHYADLPSLPVSNGPVLVHHIPRYLASQRSKGEDRIALVVFDGLAIDQWVQIREDLSKRVSTIAFDESACFAWLPTLTSVSRQAIFAGLKPREFADTIDSTAAEPSHWLRFWQDHGLRPHEVFFRKGMKRNEQLAELGTALSDRETKIAGIVVDTVDGFVHGAELGKRGIAAQIENWCESGFVESLLVLLMQRGFHVYMTADHGNVEARGQGRPKQSVAAETKGERVRIYRSELLAVDAAASHPNTDRLEIAGLPSGYLPLFAGEGTAFIPQGEQAVVHGGISIEELLVPFIKVVAVT